MPVKKLLEIEVDASKLERARRAIIHIDTLNKNLLKTTREMVTAISALLSKERESIEARKKESAELIKQREYLRSIQSLEEARTRSYLKRKEALDLESEQRRKGLEKPKLTALEQLQRYRGLPGAFLRLGEMAEEQGQERLGEIDRELLQRQQARESAREAFEKAQKRRSEIEAGVFDEAAGGMRAPTAEERAAAEAGVESAQAALESSDEAVREKQEERSEQAGQTKAQAGKYAAMAQAAAKAQAALEKMGKAVINLITKPFKQLTSAVIEATKAMLDMRTGAATYSASSSLITNAAAREQQLKYGLSSAQNYAFSQAKSLLNIQSDEDLMYMNEEQRERFLQYMEKYSQWFDKLSSSGALESIQEMQLEFAELKQELAMEFLQWIAENKDTIMACIRGMFEFIKAISEAVMAIMTLFGAQRQDLYAPAETSDRISSVTNSPTNTNITINANTTNNATGVLGSQEALDRFNEENWSRLAKQVVSAIGG